MMDGAFQSFWHSRTLYTATHASPAIPARKIPTAAVIPSIHPISLSPFVFSNPLLHPALCQDGCLLFRYVPAYNQNLPCFSYVHPLISCTSSPSGHFFLYGFCSSNKKRRIPPIMEVPSISYTNIFFLTQLHWSALLCTSSLFLTCVVFRFSDIGCFLICILNKNFGENIFHMF